MQMDGIPLNALKNIPYFIGNTVATQIEHIQDMANICFVHNITEDNVDVKLLATSLKGKELQWYRGLQPNSIKKWDELGERLFEKFEDKSDHLSLVEQLTTIKRDTH